MWSYPRWSAEAAAYDLGEGWSLDGRDALIQRTSNDHFAATTLNRFKAAAGAEVKIPIDYFEIMEAK